MNVIGIDEGNIDEGGREQMDQNAQSKRRREKECRSLGVDQRGHLVEASERKLKLELCMQD